MTLRVDRSRPEQAKVTFIWPRRDPVGTVSVVGTFNNWTPGLDELTDAGDGTRTVTLGLPYNERFVFRYLGPNGEWLDDPDADGITVEGSIVLPIAPKSGGLSP